MTWDGNSPLSFSFYPPCKLKLRCCSSNSFSRSVLPSKSLKKHYLSLNENRNSPCLEIKRMQRFLSSQHHRYKIRRETHFCTNGEIKNTNSCRPWTKWNHWREKKNGSFSDIYENCLPLGTSRLFQRTFKATKNRLDKHTHFLYLLLTLLALSVYLEEWWRVLINQTVFLGM